ncbi:C-GCAxxG-C-C family protein [Baileyella intestinalis]|uniref:C-GCAxxG-C-C family protein n=1 Tax=Baileyella intestinalis TaxID=2606709 RepID=UPI0022DF1791|nr:C-GCAxxG-C-C family protein [Baileyella intestinalis]
MVDHVDFNELKEETERVFRSGFMCSETAVYVLNKFFDLGMPESAMAMATGFPYGFGDGGNVCGGVAGATMCLGMVFGRTVPGDPKYKKCLELVRELNDDVIKAYETTICPELIKDYDFKDPERKDHCVGIMMAVVTSFAKIMEREKGIKIVR